jgi:UDP-glucose 4-epimerase
MSATIENTNTNFILEDRVVVVGAHTILGSLLIDALEKDENVHEFFVIDLHAPTKKTYKKLRFIRMDLIAPGSDAILAAELERIKATSLIHCALKNNPSLNWVYAHELEVIGTLNLVHAAKAAKLRKFVLCSSTAVYGASPKNPNYLSESTALAKNSDSHFVKDKVEAEKQLQLLIEESTQMIVTILRFCLILGPRSDNYFTELFRRSAVPTLLGYDPLMQFIHERDALRALKLATYKDFKGAFNIVGHGVIPLSYALRQAGKLSIPLPSFLAYPAAQVLWNLQMLSVPGKLLDFFKYLWVADGLKAKQVMGFESHLSSKEAFIEFAKSDRLERYSLAS